MRLKKYTPLFVIVLSLIIGLNQGLYAERILSTESKDSVSDVAFQDKKKTKQKKKKKKYKRKRRNRVEEEILDARAYILERELYNGTNEPLRQPNLSLRASLEPIIFRFSKGDKQLSYKEISKLYYEYKSVRQPKALEEAQVKEMKQAIDSKNFPLALGIGQKQLRLKPLDLTLLETISQLAHHLENNKYKLYIYQLTELLHTIASSGDGETAETAYQVRSLLDIIRFGDLWLGIGSKQIVELKIQQGETESLVTCIYKDEDDKEEICYYKIVK